MKNLRKVLQKLKIYDIINDVLCVQYIFIQIISEKFKNFCVFKTENELNGSVYELSKGGAVQWQNAKYAERAFRSESK